MNEASSGRPPLRLSLELTDGCNLRCLHCFKALDTSPRFLDPGLIDRLLVQFEELDIPVRVVLTGGEPTLHPELERILEGLSHRGLPWSIVTNGIDFSAVAALIEAHAATLEALSFSLDGAGEATHDALRGKGSFRKTVAALVHCRERGLPAQINCVVTPDNRNELDELVRLATTLGCRALGLAHCKPTMENESAGRIMSPAERRNLEADIGVMQDLYRLPILLAGDHWAPDPSAGCPQLDLREFHVDVLGRLRACCETAGYRGTQDDLDILLDLNRRPVVEGLEALAETAAGILHERKAILQSGCNNSWDGFLCTACFRRWGIIDDVSLITG